jgi:hypothetical protein
MKRRERSRRNRQRKRWPEREEIRLKLARYLQRHARLAIITLACAFSIAGLISSGAGDVATATPTTAAAGRTMAIPATLTSFEYSCFGTPGTLVRQPPLDA